MGLAIGSGVGVLVCGVNTVEWLVVGAAASGAALLPDFDTTDSTIASAFGFIGSWAANKIGSLAGGHRKATHSLLAVGLVFLLFLGGDLLGVSAIFFGILLALGWRALSGFMWGLRRFYILVGVLGGIYFAHVRLLNAWGLALAVALGYAIHLLGDLLTSGGVPLLWPKPRREALPIFGNTGGIGESIFGIGLFIVTVIGGFIWYGHHIPSVVTPTQVHQSALAHSGLYVVHLISNIEHAKWFGGWLRDLTSIKPKLK